MTFGDSDPEVSVAMSEFALMSETGMTPLDIDSLPAERVTLYMAIAETIQSERAKQVKKLGGP